ncbi:hypothetical protein GPN2_22136 [Streptomyces murinus]
MRRGESSLAGAGAAAAGFEAELATNGKRLDHRLWDLGCAGGFVGVVPAVSCSTSPRFEESVHREVRSGALELPFTSAWRECVRPG